MGSLEEEPGKPEQPFARNGAQRSVHWINRFAGKGYDAGHFYFYLKHAESEPEFFGSEKVLLSRKENCFIFGLFGGGKTSNGSVAGIGRSGNDVNGTEPGCSSDKSNETCDARAGEFVLEAAGERIQLFSDLGQMKELSVVQVPSVAKMDRLPLQMSFNASELLMRYPMGFPSPSNQGYLSDFKLHLPPSLATDPRLWSREDVVYFLRWCEAEFDLPHFDIDLFQMNGKALCFLTKSDLNERCSWSGRVLHNVLQLLIRETNSVQRCLASSPGAPSTRHPSYPFGPLPYGGWSLSDLYAQNAAHVMNSNPVTLSPAPSTDSQSRSPEHSSSTDNHGSSGFESGGSTGSHHSDSEEENFVDTGPPAAPPPAPSSPGVHKISGVSIQRQHASHHAFPASSNDVSHEPNTNGRLLWDFLQQLLNDPAQRYTNFIAWKNHETGVFKIVDPAGLAKLWGIQKNHLSMNYDKMSRALRYYYRVNILRKVQGERHCYQFLRNPSELKSIKNISLLRQQISLQQQQQQQQQQSQTQAQPELSNHPSVSIIPVKKEVDKDEDGENEEEGDGPTDLSTRVAGKQVSSWTKKPEEESEKPTDLTVNEPTMHLTIVKSE